MPLAIVVLGLAIFCLGTTEFMISGLLPDLSTDLHVSIPSAGLLISGFAFGVAIGGPLLTVVLLKSPRKPALLLLMAGFVAGQTLGALAPTYTMLLIARVITAIADGAFFGIGAAVAVDLAGPARRGKAIAVMFGGLTIANVAGVPLGTWIGQQWGWRASFWSIDLVAVIATLGVAVLVPASKPGMLVPVRHEFATLTNPRIWVALATTMFSQAGLFAAFSYLAPLLTTVTHLSSGMVPLVLVLFGAGTVVGSTVGGRFADRYPLANLYIGLAVLAIVLVAVALVAHHRIATVATIGMFGIAAFAINPALQSRVMAASAAAPTLASTVNISAFNLGNTVGPWAGGAAIAAGYDYPATALLGAAFTTVSLGTAALAGFLERHGDSDYPAIRVTRQGNTPIDELTDHAGDAS